MAGAHTSGNQLGEEKSRIDFTLENLDRDKIQGWIDRANEIISKGGEVKIEEISREEAMERLEGPSKHLMADLPVLRMITIEGIDTQTCGGTHLKDIGEIGRIELLKVENKGKNNRRIYYKLQGKA
jgi:misacylated tRNA(Ala) deacylase